MGGIPRDGIGAHRMRRTGTSPRVDAGQNFHVTAGRCATKDVVLARSPGMRRCRHHVSFQSLPCIAKEREMNLTQFTFRYAFTSVATLLIYG
jgi:hypothetical protein